MIIQAPLLLMTMLVAAVALTSVTSGGYSPVKLIH